MPNPKRTTSRLAKPRRTQPGDSDCNLAKRAAHGDHPAFETLVRRHEQRILRTTLKVTGNNADAKDAVQGTFLKVRRSLKEFRGTTRFAAWLTHIAVDQSLMLLRKRRPNIVSLDDITATEVKDWGTLPDCCEELATSRVLSVANSELGPGAHVIFVLSEPEKLAPRSVARTLGLSVGAVKSRFRRVHLALSEKLLNPL